MKVFKKVLALLAIVAVLGSMTSCKTGQGCPTFSIEASK